MMILGRLDFVVNKLLTLLCMVCFTGLFAILGLNVFFRWVPVLSVFPSFSMGWFDEIVQMLFAWMVMTASSLLCRNSDHFKVNLIQMKLEGKKSLYVLEFVIHLATIVFFAALMYYGWILVEGAVQTTPVLKMQMKYLYMCIPFNAFIMLAYTVRDAVVMFGNILI